MLNFEVDNPFVPEEQLNSHKNKIKEIRNKLWGKTMPMSQWVDIPIDMEESYLQKILDYGDRIKEQSDTLVILGVGGSITGTLAGQRFLKDTKKSPIKIYYGGYNFSAAHHQNLLEEIKDKKFSLVVVSKSGSTLETTLGYHLLKDFMKIKYGKNFAERIFLITDEPQSILGMEAKENGYATLPVGKEIGGRFSTLTAVGLLPFHIMGFDIYKILEGAKACYSELKDENHSCYSYALHRHILNESYGRSLDALTTMDPCLSKISSWLVQLFAESQGKEGKGIFPVTQEYSSDLHSVGQFLQEGSPLFMETMFYLKTPFTDLTVEATNFSYNRYNKDMCDAVFLARKANQTPVFRFGLEGQDEKTFGYLVYFFQTAVSIGSLLLNVNPFDQNGVEVYKREMNRLLRK